MRGDVTGCGGEPGDAGEAVVAGGDVHDPGTFGVPAQAHISPDRATSILRAILTIAQKRSSVARTQTGKLTPKKPNETRKPASGR